MATIYYQDDVITGEFPIFKLNDKLGTIKLQTEPLINEYGSEYGTKYAASIIGGPFETKNADYLIRQFIVRELELKSEGVWDQFSLHIKFVATGYARQGQSHCCECGSEFIAIKKEFVNEFIPTICPNGHNRGSWLKKTPDNDFCIPIMLK